MPEDSVNVLCDAKYMRLVKRGKWEYVTRKGVSGIVGIVAITVDGKLLLVEQPRPAVGRNVIEIPAGLAGDIAGQETEELAVAARRELLEETGYEAETMEYLAEGAASAGLTDEIITLFRADGLKKVGAGDGDGSEQITLHEIPMGHVEAWLDAQRRAGKRIDLKVYGALYFAAKRKHERIDQ